MSNKFMYLPLFTVNRAQSVSGIGAQDNKTAASSGASQATPVLNDADTDKPQKMFNRQTT